MSTYFSVIRFVPDVIADERVNIGVVVVNGEYRAARCKFIRDWSRAGKIANGDARYLTQLARAFESACNLLGDSEDSVIKLLDGGLEKIASEWAGAIQLSPPKPIHMDFDNALSFVANRYLAQKSRISIESAALTKSDAIFAIKRSLTKAVSEYSLQGYRVETSGALRLHGEKANQKLDFALLNGSIKIAGFGMSVDSGTEDEVDFRINALVCAAGDIRQKYPEMPIGIVAVGDESTRKSQWDRFDSYLGDVDAALLKLKNVDEWAESRVYELAKADQ